MRLYRGKVPIIAEEVVANLIKEGFIEVEPGMVSEVNLDMEAVLNEYRRLDWKISEKAKDIVAQRGLDYSHTNRVKKQLAGKEGFGIGDKALDWIITQSIEVLLHSRNVEEVFAVDNDLRRVLRDTIRRHTEMESDLDRQVRARIKNLQEGTGNWDLEYQRVMDDVKRGQGLE